jgi:CheY-like chemotaxis protein
MDVSSVVADTEKLLRRLIGEDVTLITRLDPRAPLVRIDPGQWTQLLLNLAVNARDAMPRGGTLQIRTFAESVDAQSRHPGVAQGLYAGLEVRDDGTGMTAEVRSRIFEPFFTTKPRGKGSGLGLAVVYGVVHQAGGHIEVETEPGHGTTFTILLPATRSDEDRGAAHDRERPAARGTETVLLVEDEGSVRRVATRILAGRGYRVIGASDGEEALRALDALTESPAILVTDVVMPNMDGGELASRVRLRHPSTKILFTSGYVDESITLRGVPSGGTSFLQKPYTPQMLLARVREMLDA